MQTFSSTSRLIRDILTLGAVNNIVSSVNAYSNDQELAYIEIAVDGLNLAFNEYAYFLPNFQTVNYAPSDVIQSQDNFYSMLPTIQDRYLDKHNGFYAIDNIQCLLTGNMSKTTQLSITNNVQDFFNTATRAYAYSCAPDTAAYNNNDRTIYIYPILQTAMFTQYLITGILYMPNFQVNIIETNVREAGVLKVENRVVFFPEQVPYSLDAIDFLQFVKYRAAIYLAEQTSQSRQRKVDLQSDCGPYEAKCVNRMNQRNAMNAARKAQQHGGRRFRSPQQVAIDELLSRNPFLVRNFY